MPRIKTAENGVGSPDVASISPDHAVSSRCSARGKSEILRTGNLFMVLAPSVVW